MKNRKIRVGDWVKVKPISYWNKQAGLVLSDPETVGTWQMVIKVCGDLFFYVENSHYWLFSLDEISEIITLEKKLELI